MQQFKRYRGIFFLGDFIRPIAIINFAVKTALWLLNPAPESRDGHGFSIWYFWIPGQKTTINKEKIFSTI